MTTNPDTLPTRDDLSGKCLRCGRIANFRLVNHHPLRMLGTGQSLMSGSGHGDPRPITRVVEQVSVIECMACEGNTVVIEAEVGGQYGLRGVLWWPTDHLADLEQATGIPPEIVSAYSEGVRCLAVHAPNAAAAMFRTTIAQIVQNKGSDAAKNARTLNAAIIQMEADKTMWPDFGDWAHHVRDTGNAGAHGEAFDAVTMEQATDLQVFIREIVNFLYVQPARRAAAKAVTRKAAPPAAGGSAAMPAT